MGKSTKWSERPVMKKNEVLGWHWPQFNAAALTCRTMTDRERLGLPEYYVSVRFEHEYPEAYKKICHIQRHLLPSIVENPDVALVERLAAGNMLAIIGDPRINTYSPTMIPIEQSQAWIGLETRDLDVVMNRYSNLGLDRSWIEKEMPRHLVELNAYSIGKYPVTNLEYRAFLLETHHPELPSSWEFRKFPQHLSNHPVYSVSPESADAYCQWLAGKTGRALRLPTEAEWEYAAAGPDGLEFPWGDEFAPDFANTAETGLFTSNPVGAFPKSNSPFGACDMAGNVEEYVVDTYAPYLDGPFIRDHLVEIGGQYRIARGGSFARFRDLARTRRRHGNNPRSATYAMGFRLAESSISGLSSPRLTSLITSQT